MEDLTWEAGRLVLTRRRLLMGGAAAAAGGVLFGACGDDDGSDAATSDTTGTDSSGSGGSGGSDGDRGLALAQFFGGPMFVAGQPSRFPFGVADTDGLLKPAATPERLEVQILGPDGAPVGDPVEVLRHDDGLPRAYFPLRATLAEPGIYTVRTEIDGAATEMSVQVHAARDVRVIQPGAAMPGIETPTPAAANGVDPICTNDPPCDLHEVTVAEALEEGRPLALLVSTPAFCKLAICGPVLDVLRSVTADHADMRFLHAEVYAHPHDNIDDYAPVVGALGLHFEPVLVLVGADGKVVERIDTIFDRTEIGERLAALV